MSEPEASPQASKVLPIMTLVVRILTLIFLLVSLIILATNTATFKVDIRDVTVRFKHIYAYRYMLSTVVIGLAYTFLQIPFALHYVSLGKRLIDHDALLYFEFYGDKVILSLLATGVGAAFGATLDLKKNLDDLDTFFEQNGITSLSELRSKLDNFFNMAFLSAGFLLIGFFFSGMSSIISSLSLSKKNN